MEWIKKNYEKFALLLLAVGLLAVSGLLIWNRMSFVAGFESLKATVVQNNNIQPLKTESLEEARANLQKPATWAAHPGSLFVSRKYILKDNALIDPFENQVMLHPPVPNDWFIKNNLDLTEQDILTEDQDGDGFSNLDEFNAGTDPLDKNSHPAYTTKLRLEKFIKVPFRLVFKARPDPDSFQINTIDINQPSQILRVGDQIAKTKFKIVKFVEKFTPNQYQTMEDTSELTIQNTETGEQVVLVYGKTVDSPDSYAQFRYLWDNSVFAVKKDKEFSLKPEADVKYKLIDINEREAVIQETKTEKKITIPHLEEQH